MVKLENENASATFSAPFTIVLFLPFSPFLSLSSPLSSSPSSPLSSFLCPLLLFSPPLSSLLFSPPLQHAAKKKNVTLYLFHDTLVIVDEDGAVVELPADIMWIHDVAVHSMHCFDIQFQRIGGK